MMNGWNDLPGSAGYVNVLLVGFVLRAKGA